VNVLQLISSGGYYGAENVVVALSESLEGKNCRSLIGAFEHRPHQIEELTRQAQRRGLTVLPLLCRGRWDRQTMRAIREILISQKIDVLHTHGYKPDIYGYLASRGFGIPRVATCHLWTDDTSSVRAYEFLDSLILRRFNSVVAVSDAVAERLLGSGIQSSRIRVIENGIDPRYFCQTRDTVTDASGQARTLVVGTVGRLVPQKGLEYFLRAAKEVIAEVPEVTFVLVGEGPDREKLEHMTRALGIRRNVLFTGFCTDMPRAYAEMDLYVQASVDEGMPMAVLEALASKKAVIATSVGAVPQLVIPERTGILVPPKDVHCLKSAILRLLRDPGLRSRLAESGTALVHRNHSHDAMAEKYLAVYEQVANPQGAGSLSRSPSRKGALEVS
jgi:glycosyltransferase involved in cell wall biosynthesis